MYFISCFLEQKPDENELLRKQLQKFWDVETINSPDGNVISRFQNHRNYNGVRCTTELPFKPDHDLLLDDYKICKNR